MKRKVAGIFFVAIFITNAVRCSSDDPEEIVIEVVSLAFFVNDFSFEEDAENVNVTIPLSLNHPAPSRITATYRIVDSTAFERFDYRSDNLQGFLNFEEGDSVSLIELEIIGDELVEGDEAFYVEFAYAGSGEIIVKRSVITIVDDDERVDNSNAGVLVFPDEGYTTPLSYEGMDLVWQDEFDGTEINTEDWTFQIGDGCPNLCGWGNQELQYYTDENARLENGNLVIEAKKESKGGRNYTSTRMITKNKQSFKYGRIDIRANLPFGQGIWPALWMLGDNIDEVGWPACGEIDIIEMIGGSEVKESTAHGTAHWQGDGAKADFGGSYRLTDGAILNDKFHVFSIIWDEQKITWFIDDIKYHEIDITGEFLTEFQESFFFIFNIAVGGNWPGYPNSNTVLPQYMLVDYIRVFQDQ